MTQAEGRHPAGRETGSSSTNLARAVRERLPSPLGLWWLRAHNAQTPMDAFGALEGVVGVIVVVVTGLAAVLLLG